VQKLLLGEPVSDSRGAPEETPSIRWDHRVEKAPAERPDPGTETIPVSSHDDAGDAEVGLSGMERSIYEM